MLVQFRFKNYGPFMDEVIFDMRAVKAYKEHPYNLIKEDEKTAYLKVAAVYGANASGKSNFVDAYACFLNIVRKSFSKKDKEEKASILEQNYYPFLFDDVYLDQDTEFEATYHDNGFEYRYGYVYNNSRINYEWLYRRSITSGRQTNILERSPDNISLSASVRRTCEKYIPDIDNDVLALSFFSSLRLRTSVFKDTLNCIADIFPLRLTCDRNIDDMLNLYFSGFDEQEKEKLLTFLQAIDIGIKDISVEKNNKKVSVYTYHIGKNQKSYRVPFEIESDGTKKAIAVYSFVRIAVLYDKGLIIDELNTQLHPLLLKYIVDLFYSESSWGQLIYTTHDTTLLDKRYMRRDQVWFVSKNSYGQSSLYSLAEFKIRNDESFEKEYLGGAFGAIPILNDYSFKEDSNGN